MKSILPIIILLSFMSCNNINKNTNEPKQDVINKTFVDSNNIVVYYHQSQDLESGKIDSIRIKMWYYHQVDIIINISNEGILNICTGRINYEESLPADFCESILSLTDSIFVRKIYPVEMSRKWKNTVIESGYLEISFMIYSRGRMYKRTVNFGPVNGPYNIEYSSAFLQLESSLISKLEYIYKSLEIDF